MSQRQDKYIASLLRANVHRVHGLYRRYAGGKVAHIVGHAAECALHSARDRVLLDLAVERNLAYVEWEHEEEQYDYGDLSQREQKRLDDRLEAGLSTVECGVLYVRDKSGAWQVADSIGMVWINGHDDREDAERDYLAGGDGAEVVREALYRHRGRDDFGEFARRWQPGRWVVE